MNLVYTFRDITSRKLFVLRDYRQGPNPRPAAVTGGSEPAEPFPQLSKNKDVRLQHNPDAPKLWGKKTSSLRCYLRLFLADPTFGLRNSIARVCQLLTTEVVFRCNAAGFGFQTLPSAIRAPRGCSDTL